MARRIAVLYLVVAALWILLSDRAVALFTTDPAQFAWISMLKGWGFVVVTAALLFLALRKQLLRVEIEADARERATNALRQAQDCNRLFIEHAPAALAMFDRQMRYMAASRRWVSAFQLGGRPLLGVSHYEVFPDIPERWKEIHRRAQAGEVLSAQADPFERADGRVQWLRWEVRPWHDATGAVGGIVVFSEDISDRITADVALRESEERYRLLAENVGDVVWVLDLDSMRLTYVSPSVERLRGLTVAEALAEPMLDGLAPESAALMRETLPARIAAFTAGDAKAVTQVHELRQSRRGGGWFWIEAVTTIMRGPRGGLQLVGVSRSIEERKRVADELRNSEVRFRSAVETAPVGIFVQTDGRIEYLNEAAVKLFGAKDAAALLGTPVLERFRPGEHARIRERIRMLNEEHRAVPPHEECLLRCDGTVVEAEIAAVPFRVDLKDGGLVFAYDLTEQKRAREQLEMHEAVLRETGEIAKVGGWSFDVATRQAFWTEEVARIHDMDGEGRFKLEMALDFYTPGSRAKVTEALRTAVEEGRSYDLQLELISARGVHKWVRTIGHPIRENGKVTRVRGSFQDVTELYEATEALRESEGRFRELAETINEVFWITDPTKSQLLYLSPAFERVWGLSCAALYANPSLWADSLHPEDRDRVMRAIANLQITGDYNETYRIVRPTGEHCWVQDRAYPVRNSAGTVVRVVGVAEEITEKKRIEAQFLRAQRLEAIGALAGGVAHDLNNILTPMLMAAGVLKSESSGHDLELLEMIEKSAQRGAEIIRQLLAFSRGVEGERIVLQPRHLIREMGLIVRETFPRTIEFSLDAAPDLWPVEANSTQLHQVLMNLCVNARDAMPKGGRLRIEARNREVTADDATLTQELKPGPYVMIAVVDTGEGMAPATMARIFEPFFTTKSPGKGTGLGLSTVLGIVRSHGGHVGVYSEPGRGSQFRIYLPARPADHASAESAPSAPTAGRGEMILVVDDEAAIREATRLVLQRGGYNVLLAADGEEALSIALKHQDLRLVLTDVMMPAMDGIALAHALRAIGRGIDVIASSGLEQEEKRAELLEAGVSEILEKPCATTELLGAVRRVLDLRQ